MNGFRPLSRRCQGERREQGAALLNGPRCKQSKRAGCRFISVSFLPADCPHLFFRCFPAVPPQLPHSAPAVGGPRKCREQPALLRTHAQARGAERPLPHVPLLPRYREGPPGPVAVDMYRKGAGPLPTVCPCAARAAGDTPLAPPHQVRRGRGSGGYKSTGARSSAVPTASANSWSSRSLTVHPRFGSGRHTPSMPQCHTRRARKG